MIDKLGTSCLTKTVVKKYDLIYLLVWDKVLILLSFLASIRSFHAKRCDSLLLP